MMNRMKKQLLILMHTLIASCSLSWAQCDGISIQLDGAGADLSGGVHSINLYASSPDLAGGILEVKFVVTNTTGSDQQWKITRKKLAVPSSWVDQVCWPPLCYNASGDLYSTPNSGGNPAPIIVDGGSTTTGGLNAELKPRITPDINSAAYAMYRYYIADANTGVYLDSIDLNVNFTLSTNTIKPNPVISVSPNPASEYVTINLGQTENASVKVVDVLGKVVYTDVISGGQKTIALGEFKNGVYILVIDSPGTKTINKRLIVRH